MTNEDTPSQPQPRQPEPPSMVDADPNCPVCHGTGTDGDCAPNGSVMDIDCGCRFRHLAPRPDVLAMAEEAKRLAQEGARDLYSSWVQPWIAFEDIIDRLAELATHTQEGDKQ